MKRSRATSSARRILFMNKTIAVVAPGAMGGAVGARLAARGAKVLTSTEGRSPASVARARAANMEPVSDDGLAAADLFLSIVPPDQAVPLAVRMAARCAATSGQKPVYVDLNAISPQKAREVQAIVVPSGATFVDGGIFGHPPSGSLGGPTFYLSGPVGETADVLNHYGLTAKVLTEEVGSASALKMSYAGITKGLTALATTMILAAESLGHAVAPRRVRGSPSRTGQ